MCMVSRYLSLKPFILWRQAERPIHWSHRFGREAPLEVEIGVGNGEFLIRLAQQHPDRNFVGLDLEWASVQRVLRKIAQSNLNNVRVMQVDARIAFDRLFFPQSLHYVYALFPCPWPKKRHIKHRLFSHTFLQVLNSRLVMGGEVQIVTDHHPYIEWLLEQIPNSGFFCEKKEIPPRFDTKYERKWQEAGQKCFYEIRLRKQDHRDIPVKEDRALDIHRVMRFDAEHFHPTNHKGDITVEFLDFLYDPKRERGMQRVVVAEENLTQDFWIEIIRQGEERWYIRPARGCGMVPTLGVQQALDLVRDAILTTKD